MLMCWGLRSMSQTRLCPILKGCQYHSISSVGSKTSFFKSFFSLRIFFQLRLCVCFEDVLRHLNICCWPVSHHNLGRLVKLGHYRQVNANQSVQASVIFCILHIFFFFISTLLFWHRPTFGECDAYFKRQIRKNN